MIIFSKHNSTSSERDSLEAQQDIPVEQARCGGTPRSNVISFSYGEGEDNHAIPPTYQRRQCNEWGKLGLEGISFVFPSGDDGVGTRTWKGAGICLATDGYYSPKGTRFAPEFPANCPFVTTVGATRLNGDSVQDVEVVADQPEYDFASGGGISKVFDRPGYQVEAVSKYMKYQAPNYGKDTYNRTGRGYPDVAAMGTNVLTIVNERVLINGGTSASAPIFASLLNLINEERLIANKTPVGFVNPVLYAHPEMFNDITKGSNPGCGTKGFPAAPG